jgi:cell wall-associated NlpC family hydrolase
MTPTWYYLPERIAALQSSASRWIGTPFRENSAVPGKGGGVSCHNLVASLYFDSGCWERFEVPRGRTRAITNRNASEFLAAFDAATSSRLDIIQLDEPVLPGDSLVISDSRGIRHLGVALSAHAMLHVTTVSGVIISPLAETQKTLMAIRRPIP